ncbi:MAG: sigma-70 family RNA polymerase sigma factor, partial [Candidatus Eremiobacteraeota bacterium]|nr:sigma-70 family RNA polymerase sigma factor [Candidatus Eremiobacteraeota bacterium]
MEDAGRLMERVRERDAAAFELLYDAYHRLVYGIALRILGDVPAAEDVTQAVFLKLWSSPRLFASGNFGAWIARVTRNRALDVVRSRNVRQQGEVPETMPADDALEDR